MHTIKDEVSVSWSVGIGIIGDLHGISMEASAQTLHIKEAKNVVTMLLMAIDMAEKLNKELPDKPLTDQ